MRVLGQRAAVLAAGIFLIFGSLGASAATVTGVAVSGIGSNMVVGSTEFRAALGAPAIRYFIPLGDMSGDYGVTNGGTFGTVSDYGNGGGTLSMYLRFDPVSTSSPSLLTINFEDLDLAGANDPTGFFETVEVFDALGTSITGVIDNITDSMVSGNAVTQQLMTVNLGVQASSPLFLKIDFLSEYEGYGWNTAEFLIAQVTTVPLPPAIALFGSALAGLAVFGAAGRRRKSSDQA